MLLQLVDKPTHIRIHPLNRIMIVGIVFADGWNIRMILGQLNIIGRMCGVTHLAKCPTLMRLCHINNLHERLGLLEFFPVQFGGIPALII